MAAETAHAVHLIVTNAEFIARDPNHRSPRSERTVLEGPLHQLVALVRRQIF
jgi:hypothetical protein